MSMPLRKDVDKNLTWDLSLIYPSEEAFLADVEKVKAMSADIVKTFKGKLTDAKAINACLDEMQQMEEILVLTIHYTDLAASVDFTDAEIQQKNDKMMSLNAQVSSALSFIDTEIAALPDEVIRQAIEETKTNKGILKDILERKPHMLSAETERVLAAIAPVMSAPYNIYNMAKLADMKFDNFTACGEEFPLNYAIFENSYEYDARTEVRRAAAKAFYKKLGEYENVTAAAYNARVTQEKMVAGVRGYASVFDYLLSSQKVTREMYDRQIDLIMDKFAPHMRRYVELIKRVYQLDRITYADLKVGVDPAFSPSTTIPEAHAMIREGLSCMGPEYQAMIDEAFDKRWIDFARNVGKSTGGFCATPYGRGAFILLSWYDKMSDVFTLAHELGHAGHFCSCNSTQSMADTDVSTYFVESPSTMNELLMAHYMLGKNSDPRTRRFILSCMVGKTYYHNFVTHLLEAAYQREVYKIIDAGGSVQAETLNKIYKDVLVKFWGDTVDIDDFAKRTWMRQPHYYMGLYSYTYSAGLTVATQACLRIEREGAPAVEDWKKVLASGGTLTPMELAKLAGVDISTDKPLLDTIEYIGSMIDEIICLTDEIEAGK